MKQTKRIISMLLVLVMVFTMLPAAVQAAEQPQTSVENGDVKIEGSNGFGNLLGDEITESQESAEETAEGYEAGYSVTDLVIEGNVATVTYDTLETANLVVAIYKEDGLQMVTSGNAVVEPENTEVTVTIDGTMPQFFMAAAYLLDTYDMSPLCASYDTPMYTQEMQELLASTVHDYAEDKVLNLDEDETTNFAVYADSTKVIEYVDGYNVVTAADEETATYVIENADEQIMSLAVGDVFAYAYGEDQILIVKVAAITIDGTTVTITGDELELEEVFSHVKIEGAMDTEGAQIDTSTAGEGISYSGKYEIDENGDAVSPAVRALDGGFSRETRAKFAYEFVDTDNVEIKVELDIGTEVSFEYYITWSYQRVEFSVEFGGEIEFEVEVSGETKPIKVPVGTLCYPVLPGVFVEFTPYFVAEFAISVSGSAEYVATLGFGLENDSNGVRFLNLCKAPKVSAEAEVEGKISVGFELIPAVEVFEGVLVDAEISAEAVAVISGVPLKMSTDDSSKHECIGCVDGNISFKFKVSPYVQFLKSKKLKFSLELVNFTLDISDFYFCLQHLEAGFGHCPRINHRVTVTVVDALGKGVPGANVTTASGEALGATNEKGILSVYLAEGQYTICAMGNEKTVTVDSACKVVLNGNTPPAGGSVVSGSVASETIKDYGNVIASGNCGAQGDNVKWTLYGSGLLKLTGTGEMMDGDLWGDYCEDILKVEIDYGVTNIGECVFEWCNLTSISIPDSVTSIGGYSFQDCKGITSITIPDTVTSIGEYAFSICDNLTNIIFPDGVTSIEPGTFAFCESLRSFTIPRNVTTIDEHAFYGCDSLTSIIIPASVTRIGSWAFDGCSGLTSITFNGDAPTIESGAFSNVTATAYYPAGNATWTEDVMLDYGGNITWVPYEIVDSGSCGAEGDNVTWKLYDSGLLRISGSGKMMDYAGYSNTPWYVQRYSITRVEISDGVTSIGAYAFWGCSGMTSVSIPDGVTGIGVDAFSSCVELEIISLPDSVISIGSGAFNGCRSLTDITIPDDVTCIDFGLFWGCRGLTNVTIPDGVTSIGGSAFSGCNSLTRITIPDNVTSIGESAFSGCSSLKSVTIPDGVTNIPFGLFYGCSKLSSVTIPDVVTCVDDRAFYGCKDLTAIELPDCLTSIGSQAFYECTGIESIDIPNGVTSIENTAFGGCSNLTSITLPDGISEIKFKTFRGCTRLKEVNFPKQLVRIGYEAFLGCSLVEIVLPNGVTSISGSFQDCHALQCVSLPNELTCIGSDTFSWCDNLTQVNLPVSLTSIEIRAFEYCHKLTNITIPGNVEKIDTWAFRDCTELTTIYFSGDAPSIALTAFSGVAATAYYPANNATWTTDVMQNYGGNITWVPYTPTDTVATKKVPTKAIFGGDYSTEVQDEYILKTAAFSDLVPGKNYVLLAVVSIDVEDVLAADNLLCIEQGTAGEDGTLVFQYVQRIATDVSYVMACGASDQDLSDAVITFPLMGADTEINVVNPTVTYDGKTLTEGRDYVITGTVDYAEAGTYTCYVRGIYDYTGLVECSYTVDQLEPLDFKSVMLTLESNLTVNLKADAALFGEAGYTNPYVVFEMNGYDYVVTDYTVSGGRYSFAFNDIAPNKMNDTFTATLYATYGDKVFASEPHPYSIAKYCYSVLGRTTDSKLRTLMVDLLNYGAAAQVFTDRRTDALVNADLTAEQKSWGTSETPEMTSVIDGKYEVVENPTAVWKTVGLSLYNSVAIRLKFTADSIDGLSLKIRTEYDEWIIGQERFTEEDGFYYVTIDELNAGRMRDTLYLTFYKGDAVVSNTLRYSIESYIYKQQDSADIKTRELILAVMKYGDAASAYAY